jgi:hypothetical protein
LSSGNYKIHLFSTLAVREYKLLRGEIAMKTKFFIMSLLIAALTFIGISPASAIPPDCVGVTEPEGQIECAIQKGLEWLVSQQQVNGSFGYAPISTTGLACLKLADRGKELFGESVRLYFQPIYSRCKWYTL